MAIHCEVCEKKEIIVDNFKKVRDFVNTPSCQINIEYTTNVIGERFHIDMIMSATIKDGNDVVISCKAPYVIEYTKENLEIKGKTKLLLNAYYEVSNDGYESLKSIMDVFLLSRIQFRERSLN